MRFTIDKQVFEKFPNLVVAIPIILGFDNRRSGNEALKFLRDSEAKLKSTITFDSFRGDKRVTSYLECFKEFGVDPQKFVPAHVALASRVLEGKKLPDINPMVNLYNAMSIKYLTPFGGENLDSLYGDFVLKFAAGGEQWRPIGGGSSKPAVKGELVWGDDYDLSTRALNWRQCDRTKMTSETKNGYFIMDGFSNVNKDNIQKAADEFTAIAVKWFGGKAKIYWLGKDNSTVEIPYSSKKMDTGITGNQSKFQDRQANTIRDRRTQSDLPQLFQSMSWEGENSLSYKLRQIIFQALQNVLGNKVKLDFDSVKIEHPDNEDYGDYSSNIAMILASRLRMKPFDIATLLKSKLDEYIKEHQSTSGISDSNIIPDSQRGRDGGEKLTENMIDRAEVAGQGFINLWLRKDYLITSASSVLKEKEGVRTISLIFALDEQKKVAVEYTDPNPFKEFHLGHMYSNFIGESISRIFEACGVIVWRGDFYGDVGMHIAKSLFGLLAKLKIKNAKLKILQGGDYIKQLKEEVDKLGKLSVSDRQKFLGEGYAMGVNKYEEDKELEEEVKEINLLIYISAQDLLKVNKGWKPIINYRQYIKVDENKLKEVAIAYEAGLRWSLEYFETIYKRLGTKFDGYYPESWVGEYGMQMVKKGLKMDVLEKSEGGVVYRGEQDGLHTRVFVNKLGLPTYEAKDLGLAYAKYQDFPYDLSINVFGKEIDEYYQVVRAAMIKIEPELGKKAHYIAHGMVRLPAGKMSSRTGNVITFEWLMNETKKYALKIMQDSRHPKGGQFIPSVVEGDSFQVEESTNSTIIGTDLTESEKEKVAEIVGMGAIRYALLKGSPGNDVIFDFNKSVSFEGDSGPYLQYTYARCRSVIRKSEIRNPKSEIKNLQLTTYNSQLNHEELSLLRTIYRFPEVVTKAARTLSPNLVCSFLFDLAQKYNLFYNKHSILGKASSGKRQAERDEDASDFVPTKSVLRPTQSDGGPERAKRVERDSSDPPAGDAGVEESVKNFRLLLTSATSIILKQGLYLLGIETVEKM